MTIAETAAAGARLQAVSRTLRVLELIADSPGGTSVAQLAREIGSDNSVASRILSTLVSEGYVIRDPDTERYILSLKLISIAFRYADRLGFPAICLPILNRLSEETGELTQLAAVEGEHLVYVGTSPGKQRLTIAPNIGREVVLHATAAGKAWLATLSDEDALRICLSQGLNAITPNTITTARQLTDEIAKVRRLGYATAIGEFNEDISALAVAIGVRRFGHAVGTILVSAPSSRFDRSMPELIPPLTAAAQDIEAAWPVHMLPLVGVPEDELRR
jgi:IclR family transcriptional regulator, acetate operon repressor